jgi:hypothetical protein
MCIGRRVEEQRMLLSRGAVVFEDADVFDAGLSFASIADPPHDDHPPISVAYYRRPANLGVRTSAA